MQATFAGINPLADYIADRWPRLRRVSGQGAARSCKRVQLDEIWSFVYAKQANVAKAKAAPREAGDAWTWTAICADSKLLITTMVGQRDTEYALYFVDDLRNRLANRVQVTSDGHRPYLQAMDTSLATMPTTQCW